MKKIKKRIERLRKLIDHHRYLYHVSDRQEISEAALDSLKKELFDLEEKYPQFITADSPTQRVGGKPLEKFEKVRHPAPMLSFNDAFSKKDIEDWSERISKLLSREEKNQVDFFCEFKIDGLAIELVYENNIFATGSTRGDGVFGENVTQNLKTIEAMPLILREKEEVATELKKEGLSEVLGFILDQKEKGLVVRGEVFMTKKEFERINKEQEKKNLPTFANPRNMAAGSIRQLDSKITSQRHLDSFAYELVTDLGQKTHEEKHKILKAFGFKTNPHNKYCENLKEIFEFHEYWRKNRERIHYEIDGIVVIVNNNKIFEKLGVVGKAPRGAIAFKFPLKQATTILENIKVQVGRTGVLTPVAILKPVEIGGVTISRSTLHNEDEIKRLGLKIGDTVIVGRAGDVIPEIIKVLPELRTGKEKRFFLPKRCPVCGTKVLRALGNVAWVCPNPDCFAKKRRYFYHFISGGAFDILGVGPKIIDRLIDEEIIYNPADLFKIKKEDILKIERFAEKSAGNLIKAIQAKKKITLPRFVYALGIRNVGEKTAQDLAQYFGSLEKIKKATFEELQKVTDIGPVVAKSVSKWFFKRRNLDFLKKIDKAGVKIIEEEKSMFSKILKGKIFVLTGTLETLSREKAKERIMMLGGIISDSVSKKTAFLILGKEPGFKYEKAQKLGIRIIKEKEFLKMTK